MNSKLHVVGKGLILAREVKILILDYYIITKMKNELGERQKIKIKVVGH